MTLSDLVERVNELESDSGPEGERPPDLTKREKEILNEKFDVDPWK